MNAVDHSQQMALLLAKEQIRTLVWRYCRAVDRRDFEALYALYHADATDDHGAMFCGNAFDFIRALPDIMAPMITTVHYVPNMLIAVDGRQAQGEIYSIAWHLMETPEGPCELIAGGRYLDHYECRDDGEWKFASRRIVADWSRRTLREAEERDGLMEGIVSGSAGPDDPSWAELPNLKDWH